MPTPAHMTLQGEKQGKIEGSCDMQGREGTILVQAFDHAVTIPSDPQTGAPTGKRVHGPLTITKVFDKASPKLYQGLVSGEHMTEVTINWYRISPSGTEEHYFTHKLEDAIIVAMKPHMPNCLIPATSHLQHMEDVSFTYRSITWTWEVDGIEAMDDWKEPKS